MFGVLAFLMVFRLFLCGCFTETESRLVSKVLLALLVLFKQNNLAICCWCLCWGQKIKSTLVGVTLPALKQYLYINSTLSNNWYLKAPPPNKWYIDMNFGLALLHMVFACGVCSSDCDHAEVFLIVLMLGSFCPLFVSGILRVQRFVSWWSPQWLPQSATEGAEPLRTYDMHAPLQDAARLKAPHAIMGLAHTFHLYDLSLFQHMPGLPKYVVRRQCVRKGDPVPATIPYSDDEARSFACDTLSLLQSGRLLLRRLSIAELTLPQDASETAREHVSITLLHTLAAWPRRNKSAVCPIFSLVTSMRCMDLCHAPSPGCGPRDSIWAFRHAGTSRESRLGVWSLSDLLLLLCHRSFTFSVWPAHRARLFYSSTSLRFAWGAALRGGTHRHGALGSGSCCRGRTCRVLFHLDSGDRAFQQKKVSQPSTSPAVFQFWLVLPAAIWRTQMQRTFFHRFF